MKKRRDPEGHTGSQRSHAARRAVWARALRVFRAVDSHGLRGGFLAQVSHGTGVLISRVQRGQGAGLSHTCSDDSAWPLPPSFVHLTPWDWPFSGEEQGGAH